MPTPDMDPTAKGSKTETPLPGADPAPAPGQPSTSAAKTASEPNTMERSAGDKARQDAQKKADEQAKEQAAILRGTSVPKGIPPDISDEDAAIAAFAEEEGLEGSEAAFLKGILQARRNGTQVESAYYFQLPDDAIERVNELADDYVKQRSESAIEDEGANEKVTEAEEAVAEAEKALRDAKRDARKAAAEVQRDARKEADEAARSERKEATPA